MYIEQWALLINAFVAIGTIALAITALITVRHGIKERRNRRLEEAIEWATEIGKISVEFTADTIHKLKGADGNLYISICVDKTLLRARDLRIKTQHAMDIIESFHSSLQDAAAKLADEFESYIKALEKWYNSLLIVLKEPGSDESELEGLAIEAGNKEFLLGQCVDEFIAEANKARSRNII